MFYRLYRSFAGSFAFMGIACTFAMVVFALLGTIKVAVEQGIQEEYRPIFGSEMQFDIPAGSSGAEALITTLTDRGYLVARVRSLNTTLSDTTGQSYGAQLTTYEGDFPQYARLEQVTLASGSGASITEGLRGLVESGSLLIDSKKVPVAFEIRDTTIGGFGGFGGDAGKVITPHAFLSGSVLFGIASRVDDEVLVSPRSSDGSSWNPDEIKALVESVGFRPRFIDARSDRLLDQVNEIFGVMNAIFLAILLCVAVVIRSLGARIRDGLAVPYRRLILLGVRPSRAYRAEVLMHLALVIKSSIYAAGLLLGISWIADRSLELPIAISGMWYVAGWIEAVILVSLVYVLMILLVTLPWGQGARSRRLLMLTGPAVIVVILAFILLSDVSSWIALGVGVLIVGTLAWLVSLLYRTLSRRVFTWRISFGIRDGVRTLSRKGFPAVFLTLAFFSTLSAILIISSIALSFFQTLRSSDAFGVNLFALNITSSDYASLSASGLVGEQNSYPIIRGRITSINAASLADHLGGRESGEFRREFNITPRTAPELLSEGAIPSGSQVGVDADFSERLGVKIGDRITFLIAGRSVELTVSGIYTSVRSGVTPFFFFRVDPRYFESAPVSYFATFDTPDITRTKAEILESGSNAITFIDVDGITEQIRSITEQILQVLAMVSLLFVLGVSFALAVLFSDYRTREARRFRQYRLLGANRGLLGLIRQTTRIVPIAVSIALSIIVSLVVLALFFGSVSLLSWDMSATWSLIFAYLFLFLIYALWTLVSDQSHTRKCDTRDTSRIV